MKKSHILKKKEKLFFSRLDESFGEITPENFDTYPMGNPFRKTTKAKLTYVRDFMQERRALMTPEDKQRMEEIRQKYILEDQPQVEKQIQKEKREKVRRLFFK